MPNYGEHHREGEPISTGFVESAIKEIIAKTHKQVSAAVRSCVLNKTFMLSRTGNKVQSGGGRLPMHNN